MAQRYNVAQLTVETLLTWVKSDQIAIPEIQRPFVWDKIQVRDLLESLYLGYPVGYLISWRNPTVRLKDGSLSPGKHILIDGQQRVTALMTALLGLEVLDKDYTKDRIRIAFHPGEERFEVHNAAIAKDNAWINDVTVIFEPNADLFELTEDYVERNVGTDRKAVGKALQKVSHITNNQVGLIDLAEDLDLKTVTEIFIRANSAGTKLSQADFAMSKITVNEEFAGYLLRKAIDYFCHLMATPEHFSNIEKVDPDFAQSGFWTKMHWLKNAKDNLYKPTYIDMLRVAFTSEFERGKLENLVALLSGRDFESRKYDENTAKNSFTKLERGIHAFINQTHFNSLTMILRSAGFATKDLIGSRNAVNFSYILYLRGRSAKMNADDIQRMVRRWYAMSILTKRYSSGIETTFDHDIQQIETHGVSAYVDTVVENELPDTYWTGQLMDSTSRKSPYFIAYQAAQVQMEDKGFLSAKFTVHSMLLGQGDKHHVFPRKYLQQREVKKERYNQISNFAITQSEINKAICDTSPDEYFGYLINEQCNGGKKRYGGITDEAELRANLEANCIPLSVLDGKPLDYEEFLAERRKLMAGKIKKWFEGLS